MERIVFLTGDKELEKILTVFKEDIFYVEKSKEENVKKLLLDFKSKMDKATLKNKLSVQGMSNS